MKKSLLVISVFLFSSFLKLEAASWVKTGGPIGGLGYNIKIHPLNKKIMYVTDAFSGVQKTINGGKTWINTNEGIDSRTGPTDDEIPVFSLTIDPIDPEIIWVGTQDQGAVFKSSDGGETFENKSNGILEGEGLTIRNFAVYLNNHNRVLMAGELNVGEDGDEFSRVQGVIYRTEDGGESWTKLWQGDSLARWICINPSNSNAVVVTTGIFDREAFNITGVGAIKTTDDGATWQESNQGIDGSLFIGGMAMHDDLPGTMLIGTGNNNDINKSIRGGVFISNDAGENWEKLHPFNDSNDFLVFTATAIAPSNPKVMYAGSAEAIYKSQNSGRTWKRFAGPKGGPYGPRGIRAGVPIEISVAPDNPNIVFVNNYGGGVFKSVNGARTWKNFSTGYTGANIYSVSVSARNKNIILANGRSGVFFSRNAGDKWLGLGFDPQNFAEGLSTAIHPKNPRIFLSGDEHQATILKSSNFGKRWKEVFRHEDADASDANNRHGAKDIIFSESNPKVVYAGFIQDGLFSNPESEDFEDSFGVYRSDNTGESWKDISSNLTSTSMNITAMAVSRLDENKVYVGLREGGIYRTLDAGNSWTMVGDSALDSLGVTALELASDLETAEDIIWAGTLAGGIYKSSDSAQTWTQVLEPQEDKNMLIRSIKLNLQNQNEIFAADWYSGVYQSNDAGDSWQIMNDGLSTRAVNNLAISNDGEVLYAATRGEGVFRLE